MRRHLPPALTAAMLVAAPLSAQVTTEPFPAGIPTANPTVVGVTEFARLPDVGGEAARMMLLVDEPGTRRLFVNGMTGPLWSVSYDGRGVTEYLNTDDDRWGMPVQSQGRERGFQSFAFHPDFAREGAPGYGKLYTWSDTESMEPAADFRPGGGEATNHTVLLEWTARNPAAASLPTTPGWGRAPPSRRSGSRASATRSASDGTRPTAISSSPTSGRTSSRR